MSNILLLGSHEPREAYFTSKTYLEPVIPNAPQIWYDDRWLGELSLCLLKSIG